MYNYNIKKIALSAIIAAIIIVLFFNIVVFSPFKSELESSLKNNFLNKVSINELNIENRFEKYIETAENLSSKNIFKNQLRKYNEKEITLEELKKYTQTYYIAEIKLLNNVLAALRVADKNIISRYEQINIEKSMQYYNKISKNKELFIINDSSSLFINSPILDYKGKKIANDLILFDISNLMKTLNENEIKYELIKADETIKDQINQENYIIEYRKILDTNYLLKASEAKENLYESVNSITNKIITAFILLMFIFLAAFYIIISNAFNNIIAELKEKIKKLNETKKLLENLTNQVPGSLYQFQSKKDGSYFLPYGSKGFKKLFDLSPEEDKDDIELIYSKIDTDDFDKFLRSIKYSEDNLTAWHNIFRIKTSRNEFRWLESSAQPEKLNNGEILWHGYVRDITERKQEKDRLEIQHQFQKSLANISSNLVNLSSKNFETKINRSLTEIGNFFDIEYIHILKLSDDKKTFSSIHAWNKSTINSVKEEIQDLSAAKISWWIEQLKKRNYFTVCDIEDLPKEAEKDKEFLKSKNIKSAASVSIKIDNELFGWFSFGNINEKGICENKKINYINIFTEVITRAIIKNLNDRKIEKLTYHDALTGLYNRRFFEEEVKRLDTERNLPLSILVADLNGLKIINDSYGHDKGDEILKKSAQILKNSFREDEILARQGGDEFAALLPNTSREDIEKIVKRIKNKCQKTKTNKIPISIALGTATKVNKTEKIEDIVKKADDKMYQNKLSESRSSKSNIVKGLINVLNAKSSETKEHALRMTSLAFEFGEKLALSNFEQNRLSILATLHDIGKTNISEKILKKKTTLTDSEWEIIKKHPEYGYKIATSSEEFAAVADDILSHHERWDGKGYPHQLKAEEIPYLARIISIVDAYDVMTNERPYSKAISVKAALEEIKDCKGSQFDPKLAEVFIEMIKEKQKLS